MTSFETIVSLIDSTTTRKGLKVISKLDETEYKKGIMFADEELKMLNIHLIEFHGELNYTIKPLKY